MSHGAHLQGKSLIMWFFSHNSSMYGPAGVKPFRVARTTNKAQKMEKKNEQTKPKGLWPKMLELQKAVRALLPDQFGGGQRNNYKYVSGSKLLGYLRPKMDELGLILKQEVLEIKNDRIDYFVTTGQKSEMFTCLKLKFTWVDVDSGERDENVFIANGQNGWDKGLGSALTYGERYFLLKYFHIATDEDDVDAQPIREAIKINEHIAQQSAHPTFAGAPSQVANQEVQPGDGNYMKLLARINKGQTGIVNKAINSGMLISATAKSMLEQAERDYATNKHSQS